jgi:hypothetical protein
LTQIFPQITQICANLRENPRQSAGNPAPICGKISIDLRENLR